MQYQKIDACPLTDLKKNSVTKNGRRKQVCAVSENRRGFFSSDKDCLSIFIPPHKNKVYISHRLLIFKKEESPRKWAFFLLWYD